MNGGVINADLPKLAPPTSRKLEVREKGKLVLQLLKMTVLLLPALLMAVYRRLCPPTGKSLRGNVVLVSGAGRGLGRGLAVAFSKEGCKVACVDIDRNTAAETADIIRQNGNEARAYVTNVAKPEDVRMLADHVTRDLGPVDILVNNAAIVAAHNFSDPQDNEILGGVNVNFLSHFWMIRTFLPSMQKRNTGHIVAISSLSAFSGIGRATTYSSCKWAVTGLMDSLREELRSNPDNNINLTVVHPYYINTSADYTDRWEIRLPELTIDEVVGPTIEAVKRNQFMMSIPEHVYYVIHFVRLLPQSIMDLFRDIMYSKFTPPSAEEWSKHPQFSIIADTVQAKKIA